jgi:hypothetical protein
MNLTDETRTAITTALTRRQEDLFEELGVIEGKNALPIDSIRRGREIFENLIGRLRPRICSNRTILIAVEREDEVALVAGVVDCISGAVTGISPVTIAVLFVRYGVKRLCEDPKAS